jgi:hypothetical protein
MPEKIYESPENESLKVCEPAVAYNTNVYEKSVSDRWNPNVPFVGTQEEWWEHFHKIEQGKFMRLEAFDHRFEVWRRELLASKLS